MVTWLWGAEARERLPAELALSTTPGRVFKRSADLKKLCRRGMRSYRFYLFNDMILYCKYVVEHVNRTGSADIETTDRCSARAALWPLGRGSRAWPCVCEAYSLSWRCVRLCGVDVRVPVTERASGTCWA